ncbi:MAG: hypothetical protein RI907_2901 [Pseudomonadota bacterium]|jgi:hypothetical protein
MPAATLAPHPWTRWALARSSGVWLWLWGTLALVAMAALLLGGQPDVDAIRRVIRATARTSLCCFLLAYMASTLRRHGDTPWTQGLVRHRRWLGLLFASSHTLHAIAIGALFMVAEPDLARSLTPPISRWVGGAGYVALLAMALTSSDRAVQALGWARWQALHRWGAHLIWLVFFLSMAKRAPGSVGHAAMALILLGLLAFKLRGGRP